MSRIRSMTLRADTRGSYIRSLMDSAPPGTRVASTSRGCKEESGRAGAIVTVGAIVVVAMELVSMPAPPATVIAAWSTPARPAADETQCLDLDGELPLPPPARRTVGDVSRLLRR